MSELDHLEHVERLALVGLARVMVRLDQTFSEDEAVSLSVLADKLGSELFWQLVEEASASDDDDIRSMAKKVTRASAREEIYGTLFELAQADTITDAENKLLDWLAEEWDLSVTELDA